MPAAKPTAASQQPTIGRIVIYQDRLGPRAAVITATVDTVNEEEQLPKLSSESHVHLTVFVPSAPRPQWDVPLSSFNERLKGAIGKHRHHTWHWPERV